MEMQFGNEVNRFYVEAFRKVYTAERAAIAALKTKEDALEYVKNVRAKVRSCFKFPENKCPLSPVVTGVCSNEFCDLEKLYFFSRPGYPVTANFFLPKKREGKLPAVLMLCGHSKNGKASVVYQTAALGLVSKGFAVLVIDPIGQGERISLAGKGFPEFTWTGCTCEHNCEGKPLLLSGEWFGAWRTWDGVRAVDYLFSRPEVDSSRIGITGNSGGGTLTTWINAVEDRLSMTAASCYITTWKNNVENELPADIEQMPPGAAALGLEMADFLLASAPRPLLIMGQKNDFFDPRGLRDTYCAVKHVYDLLGARVECFAGPTDHGYSIHNRETMYGFFTGLVQGRIDKTEVDIVPFKEEETYAASGDIANIPENLPFHKIAADLADHAIAQRKPLTLPELKERLISLIKPGETFVPEYRVLRVRRVVGGETLYSRFALETEPGEVTSLLKRKANTNFFHLPMELKQILLYIPHLDSQDEMETRSFPAQYEAIYGLDMRGIGELAPAGCDQPLERDFFHPYRADYHYAALSFLLDSPLLGKRVHDILCAAELLTSGGAVLDIEANRQGCIPALMAALLSDKIRRVHLVDGLDSYESLVRLPATAWPYAVLVPDVLRYLDLPELRHALREKLVECL